jgi:peptidoglycan/LPS O-acetylase OafA/YrhL
MKSSTGKYFIALDHIRALAAFMVFIWHFVHASNGYPIAFEYTPTLIPFSILNEGHTGVALFMTLSGYLFAKLLDGKKIHYGHFLWNRFLRLAPLLFVVILLVGINRYFRWESFELGTYLNRILKGAIYPTLPNGGWSITAEFHFYLVLPLLLIISWKYKAGLFLVVIATVLFRFSLYSMKGEVQSLSYWTIVGRIDQFILGIVAYQFHNHLTKKHYLAIGAISFFLIFYWWFDSQGGFYNLPSYPSSSILWVVMPTIEGAVYGVLISWYDNLFDHSKGRISKFLSLVGNYSYSIYLLHFFIVFKLADFINKNIIDISNFYLAVLIGGLCFLVMVPIGHMSFKFIESPFLRLRTLYVLQK